jgi:predicted ATPase/DNA-binding SARP family transcriptional activator
VQLKLYLFGPPRIERAAVALDLNLRKGLALLAYLAVTQRAHSRDALATLLWPEHDQQSARANLRRTLYEVGQVVGSQVIESTSETVALQAVAIWLDVDEFRRSLAETLRPTAPAAGPQLAGERLARLVEAADLYTADFMAGFSLPDCPDYDDWQFFEREELRRSLAQALEQAVSAHEAQEDWPAALRQARRWLALDPLDEGVQRRLMQLYALAGQPGAALRQYAECVRLLAQELDATPDAATTALYDAIRTRRFPPADQADGHREPPVSVPPAPASALATPAPSTPVLLAPQLPVQATPFVGRRQELAELVRRLRDPDCRLLTIVGPGGIGKTRLALAAAQSLLDDRVAAGDVAAGDVEADAAPLFEDGVMFVPLQPVDSASRIVPAIAEALGLQFFGAEPPQQQLLQFLREKRLLLVLDNFEQLLPGAELAVEILTAAPGVKLLVTSREALKLQEEWFHPLAGMRLPPVTPGPRAVEASDAVALFVQSARRAVVGFDPSVQQHEIGRICRLVDGMPLALELAASWLKLLSCAQIADEIEHGLDILVARHQNVPMRHRSMRILLEQSWEMLSEVEQNVLERLSVFQGGFRPDAAAEIAGSTLLTLATLVEKSLLQAAQNGRFQMHELLRQFAEQKLDDNPETAAMARRQYAAFYLRFVQQRTERLLSREQREALSEIDHEIDNVRAALSRGIAQGAADAIDGALHGLFHYYKMRGRFQEGHEAFGRAISQFSSRAKDENANLLSRLAARQVHFCISLGRYVEAEMLLSLAVSGVRGKDEEAHVLLLRGVIADKLYKDRTRAEQWLRQSLEISQQIGDLAGQILALERLAYQYGPYGRPIEAEALLAEAVRIGRQLGQPTLIADTLESLGWFGNFLGHYAHAKACWEEALGIYQEFGNTHGIGSALNWLGWADWCAGEPRPAISYYEQAISLYKQTGAQVSLGNVLGDMALALIDLGDLERAMNCALEGLRLCESARDIHFTLYTLTTAGAAACAKADYANARRYLMKSLLLAQETQGLNSSAPAVYYFANVLVAESEITTDVDLQAEKKRQALHLYDAIIHDSGAWQAIKDRAKVGRDHLAIQPSPVTVTESAEEVKTVAECAAQILAGASRSGKSEG